MQTQKCFVVVLPSIVSRHQRFGILRVLLDCHSLFEAVNSLSSHGRGLGEAPLLALTGGHYKQQRKKEKTS